MGDETDGVAIARRRIAEEAAARTGVLDLGRLGLTALPDELFRLTHLRRLNLGRGMVEEDGTWSESRAKIADNDIESSLERLRALPELQVLSVCGCGLASLTGIAGLSGLRRLDCSDTPVSDLGPLAGLTALQQLECWNTQVSGLGPLAGLTALQQLECWNTQVSDLEPLAGLTALQQLDCGNTRVSDLGPLAGLTALQQLECSGCHLTDLPQRLLHKPSLEKLVLYYSRLPGVPAAVLSQSWTDNCLESLRAHVRDLAAGAVRGGGCQADGPGQRPGRQNPALPPAAQRGL